MSAGVLRAVGPNEITDEEFERDAKRPSTMRTGLQEFRGFVEPGKKAALGQSRRSSGRPTRTSLENHLSRCVSAIRARRLMAIAGSRIHLLIGLRLKMPEFPSDHRYERMTYNRCGRSGLKFPAVSLGLWHNFGGVDPFESCREIMRRAFDLGITHFDLANNYGPPPGSAEETFGEILKKDLAPFRDELIISTKAGYTMWPGPYGDWGSRKYILASLDQSLKRMGLEYVDVFYHHRPDPETSLEESMGALDQAVRSGRALYAAISNYRPDQATKAIAILRDLGTPCLIHQAKYSMFNRWVEDGLLDLLATEGVGCIAFSPLAQGMLTDKYLEGIPPDSRAAKPHGFLKPEEITTDKLTAVLRLRDLARGRGQSLAQMAIAWVLRHPGMTSALIGASRASHVEELAGAYESSRFSETELKEIDRILHA